MLEARGNGNILMDPRGKIAPGWIHFSPEEESGKCQIEGTNHSPFIEY